MKFPSPLLLSPDLPRCAHRETLGRGLGLHRHTLPFCSASPHSSWAAARDSAMGYSTRTCLPAFRNFLQERDENREKHFRDTARRCSAQQRAGHYRCTQTVPLCKSVMDGWRYRGYAGPPQTKHNHGHKPLLCGDRMTFYLGINLNISLSLFLNEVLFNSYSGK